MPILVAIGKRVFSEDRQSGIEADDFAMSLSNQDAIPEGLTQTEWGKIRASIERYVYQVHKDTRTGVYRAPNHTHDFDATFSGEGFDVRPRKEGKLWNWGLRLNQYGYGADLRSVPETDRIITKDNRIEYHRGDMVEWYINDHRGLEQGFTLKARPSFQTATGFLQLQMRITGNLIPDVEKDRKGIVWKDINGNEILNYSGLYAYDATGKNLPTRMEVSNFRGASFTVQLLVDVEGAVYPVTIDPTIEEVKKLVASDAEAADYFGYSVSISGDTVVVGAYGEDSGGTDAGAAYVFAWTEGYVATSGIDAGDCSDPLFPCKTIAYARQQVSTGTINVARGRYVENIYISSATTGLTIRGGWDQTFSSRSEDPGLTTIDGGNMDSFIELSAQSIARIDLSLISLTLTGGNNTPGGGITIANEALGEVYLSLYKCAIKSNEGGGIAVSSSRGTTHINLDSCVVMDNITGGYGGGLDAYTPAGNLKIDIVNTIIAGNHASHKGGGIRVFCSAPQATLSIRSSTISDNSGDDAGGVYLWAYGGGNVQANILNSILWGNRSNDLDLILHDTGMGTTMSVGAMYSDIGIITDVFGLYSDSGNNISENPLFLNPTGGDYHLKEESPAVDNALCGLLLIVPPPDYFRCVRMAPLLDFEGDRRPLGCATDCDMGADEFKLITFPWLIFYPAMTGAGR